MNADQRDDRAHFAEQYRVPRPEASLAIDRQVLGTDIGLNGYTTLTEARRLLEVLDLPGDALVLDLGAGRGWPGLFIAESAQARVVLSDVPIDALRQARVNAFGRALDDRTHLVVADGVALPFRNARFDAVTHADVFC